MEQIVTVRKTYADGTAEILCRRQSACSGNCAQCGGCSEGAEQTHVLRAENPIGAQAGDRVVLRSSTGHVLAAAMMVYLVPIVLLIVLWCALGADWGFAGFAIGMALAVLTDRLCRRRGAQYTITAQAK